jgi:Domain of unknown function (DUF4124)
MHNTAMPRPRSVRAAVLACVAVVAASAGTALAQEPAKGRSYKWTDEKGVTHYGDRIPPEYAKRERTVLNEQGVAVRKLEAEKSIEQQRADEAAAEAARKQRDHDSFLLTTYTSVRDIESLRDQRLQQIADQRLSVQSYIDTLRGRLDALQARAQGFKPYNAAPNARRMPDPLAEDLVRTINEVRRQESSVRERLAEETTLRNQFQADIDRFKTLRGGTATTSSTSAAAR